MFKQATGTMILLVYVGDSSRKAREAFLIQKGRTISLDSLNIECRNILNVSFYYAFYYFILHPAYL